MKAPYGFVEDDIHWLVARLFKRGDLSFTVNGESVNLNNRSEEEIIGYITKKQFVDKLLTEVRVRVPENQKKAVRTVMKELFKVAPPADDEDTIMKNFQHYCENRITEIDRLEPKYENYAYPGKELLEKGKKRLSALVQIQAPLEFFKTVFDEQDDLMDLGEDYEPIRDFFGSEQLTIFTRALDTLSPVPASVRSTGCLTAASRTASRHWFICTATRRIPSATCVSTTCTRCSECMSPRSTECRI